MQCRESLATWTCFPVHASGGWLTLVTGKQEEKKIKEKVESGVTIDRMLCSREIEARNGVPSDPRWPFRLVDLWAQPWDPHRPLTWRNLGRVGVNELMNPFRPAGGAAAAGCATAVPPAGCTAAAERRRRLVTTLAHLIPHRPPCCRAISRACRRRASPSRPRSRPSSRSDARSATRRSKTSRRKRRSSPP
jgi:hypothetical protein